MKMTVSTDSKTYLNFINGEWVKGSEESTAEIVNPATGEVIANIQKSTKEDVEKAVDAADKAKKVLEKTFCS